MRVRGLLVLWGALTIAGCSCGDAVQKVDPSLGPTPEDVPFGLVAVGDGATQSVRLEALTAADVEVQVTIEESDSPFHLEGEVPTVVPAKSTVDVTLSFRPTAVESYVATLVVSSNDPDLSTRTRRILLSGEGKSPQIKVTPDHLTLGAIACPSTARSARCSDQQSVTLENVGEVALSLGKVEIKPSGEQPVPAPLKIAKLVSTTSLPPGAKIEVPISWKPTPAQTPNGQSADYEAKLVVPSNDPAKPSVEVALRAHADPNAPPTACIDTVSVRQRKYVQQPDGRIVVQQELVDPLKWRDAADPRLIHVRPGMTITLTSTGTVQDPTDPTKTVPCTQDPEGDALTRTWAISARDLASGRASITPQPSQNPGSAQDEDAVVVVDAVGLYDVGLIAKDTLQLTGTAGYTIDAQPQDDLFAQLDWRDAPPGVDLDLHLLVDSGPGIAGPGELFCKQDCFFYNQQPTWFTASSGDQIPRFLRDDTGNGGGLEAIDLVKAPPGSTFRLAVHYFGGSQPVTPAVTVRHLGTSYGPYKPTQPLQGSKTTWYVAKVEFPANGADPIVTPLSVPTGQVEPPPLVFGQMAECQ